MVVVLWLLGVVGTSAGSWLTLSREEEVFLARGGTPFEEAREEELDMIFAGRPRIRDLWWPPLVLVGRSGGLWCGWEGQVVSLCGKVWCCSELYRRMSRMRTAVTEGASNNNNFVRGWNEEDSSTGNNSS